MMTLPELRLNALETKLADWLAVHRNAETTALMEKLPLRHDTTALLTYVRDHKVIGTATGNMPVKNIKEALVQFLNPPKLEYEVGGKVYKIHSEDELWMLHYQRVLAEVGGLLKPGKARLWKLTKEGERYLAADPVMQTVLLALVWWSRVDWRVAFPYQGLAHGFPPGFYEITLRMLAELPVGRAIPFIPFADKLITKTRLTWIAPESSFAHHSLQSAVKRMIIDPLLDYDAAVCGYQDKPLGNTTIQELETIAITPWGRALLTAIGRIRSV